MTLVPGGGALHVPPRIWHLLHGFAPNTVCAVFSSTAYDPADYVMEYSEFVLGREGA